MMVSLSIVEARNRFAEVISRAGFGAERIVIARHRKPLAVIVPLNYLTPKEQQEARKAAAAMAKTAARQRQGRK